MFVLSDGGSTTKRVTLRSQTIRHNSKLGERCLIRRFARAFCGIIFKFLLLVNYAIFNKGLVRIVLSLKNVFMVPF